MTYGKPVPRLILLPFMVVVILFAFWGCNGVDIFPVQSVESNDIVGDSDTFVDTDVDTDTDTDTEDEVVFDIGSTTVYVVDNDVTYITSTLGPVEGEASLSQYGGDITRNVGGTGFFRTHLVDGRWYFVDPDGYIYIQLAQNSVIEGGGIELPEALIDMGFNGLGNWSDYETINSGDKKMPYTASHAFLSQFKNDDTYDDGTSYLEDLFSAGILPVVLDDFEQSCEETAQQLAQNKDDPWLLGIFSDAGLPFHNDSSTHGDVIDRWFTLPLDDAYYQYAEDWLIQRGKTVSNYDDTDKDDFAAHIVSVYYSRVNAAIKKHDPNHLLIGTRLYGEATKQPGIMAAAGAEVDVIGVNFYDLWTPNRDDMDMWLSTSGKPFIITHFCVKGVDSGLTNEEGVGWTVQTQEDRGLFYTHFILNLFTHPGAIGAHWFRYIDRAGEDSNKGFLSEEYEWYVPLVEEAYNTNKQIYALVEYLK